MKTLMSLIGILLIAFGVLVFAYQGFSYTKEEKIAQIGNIQVTADSEKRVYLSPLAGGASLIAGLALVFIARGSRK